MQSKPSSSGIRQYSNIFNTLLRSISYSVRILLALLLAALIPLLLSAILANVTLNRLSANVMETVERTVLQMRLQFVEEKAISVAQQIRLYVQGHPELAADISSLTEDKLRRLQTDEKLAAIAVQYFGNTGSTFVVTTEGFVLFHPDSQVAGKTLTELEALRTDFTRFVTLAVNNISTSGEYKWEESDSGVGSTRSAIFTRMEDLPFLVAASEDTTENAPIVSALAAATERLTRSSRLLYLFFLAVGIALTVGLVWAFSNQLTDPIRWSGETARRLLQALQNMFTVEAPAGQNDIGWITATLISVDKLVREELSALERQVRLRTGELVQRAAQMEAVVQITRESADILDASQLLIRTTRLISDRFAFYHAGIYLIDDASKFALLQAASSEGGQRMLARGYKVEIGKSAFFTQAVQKLEPVLYKDTDQDGRYLTGAELSSTRSGLLLPMRARGRVIGLLDVQSSTQGAFGEDNVRIMRVLADQVALAMENARLFDQSQRAIRELEKLYGKAAIQAWGRRLGYENIGYSYNGVDVKRLLPSEFTGIVTQDDHTAASQSGLPTSDTNGDTQKIRVPLVLQGQPIGTILLSADQSNMIWGSEEQNLVQEVAIQIGQALESARLLEEIRTYAQQERQISQVISQVQGSLDMNSLLQKAVSELGKLPGVAQASIHLGLFNDAGIHSAGSGGVSQTSEVEV